MSIRILEYKFIKSYDFSMSPESVEPQFTIQDVLGNLRVHAQDGDKLDTRKFLGDVYLIQQLGFDTNPAVQRSLEMFGQVRQEIIGKSVLGLLKEDIENKDADQQMQIQRKVIALEMLKLDRLPAVSILISNLRQAYNLEQPGEAEAQEPSLAPSLQKAVNRIGQVLIDQKRGRERPAAVKQLEKELKVPYASSSEAFAKERVETRKILSKWIELEQIDPENSNLMHIPLLESQIRQAAGITPEQDRELDNLHYAYSDSCLAHAAILKRVQAGESLSDPKLAREFIEAFTNLNKTGTTYYKLINQQVGIREAYLRGLLDKAGYKAIAQKGKGVTIVRKTNILNKALGIFKRPQRADGAVSASSEVAEVVPEREDATSLLASEDRLTLEEIRDRILPLGTKIKNHTITQQEIKDFARYRILVAESNDKDKQFLAEYVSRRSAELEKMLQSHKRRLTEGIEEAAYVGEFMRVYEETPGGLDWQKFFCQDGSEAESVFGADFVGQILRVKGKDHSIQDRAGVMALNDGTKIFLGADGVSQSYLGNKSADAAIQVGMEVCRADPNRLFTNPEETLKEMGQAIKAIQPELVEIDQQRIKNNPEDELINEVWKKRLNSSGSQTTFFAVKISPDGTSQFVSAGDGVIQVVDRTGHKDLVPNNLSRSPEGGFSTLEGFIGKVRAGSVKLEPGQMLLFGTDGIKLNEEKIRAQLRDRTQAFDLDQVTDDLTVFAYYQYPYHSSS